jgi:hypothetical protein
LAPGSGTDNNGIYMFISHKLVIVAVLTNYNRVIEYHHFVTDVVFIASVTWNAIEALHRMIADQPEELPA